MGCQYHEERYQDPEYANRSEMAETLLAILRDRGIAVIKNEDEMPASSSGVEPAKNQFRINEPCAGCAVLHILHALAILDPDKKEPGNLPMRYYMDNKAYKIATNLGLGIDKEEWLHWCAALKPSDGVVACMDDSGQVWSEADQKWGTYSLSKRIKARPYIPGEDMGNIRINWGVTPEEGGYIVQSVVEDFGDFYVPAEYFAENYEPIKDAT